MLPSTGTFLLHLVLDIWEGTFRNCLEVFTPVCMVSYTIQARWLTEWQPSLLEDRFGGGLESSPPAATTHIHTYSTGRVWILVENVRIWLPFRSEDRACRELSLQVFKGSRVLAFYTGFNTFEQYPICRSAFYIFSLNMGGIYHITNWAKIILPWVINVLITFLLFLRN